MKYYKWFPELHQVYFPGKNPSYFHSLWLGIVTPFLLFPTLLWSMVLKPFMSGIFMLCTIMFGIALGGVTGYANSRNVDLKDIALKILQEKYGMPIIDDNQNE